MPSAATLRSSGLVACRAVGFVQLVLGVPYLPGIRVRHVAADPEIAPWGSGTTGAWVTSGACRGHGTLRATAAWSLRGRGWVALVLLLLLALPPVLACPSWLDASGDRALARWTFGNEKLLAWLWFVGHALAVLAVAAGGLAARGRPGRRLVERTRPWPRIGTARERRVRSGGCLRTEQGRLPRRASLLYHPAHEEEFMLRIALAVLLLPLAGCAATRTVYRSTTSLPPQVVALAAETKPGGSFFIEFGSDGRLLGADAEVEVSSVPPALVAAANAKHPGGQVVGAEKEWANGGLVWEVVKEIDGQTWEILVTPGGQVVGGEQALARSSWPRNVVDAALQATGGGDVDAVEHVWGPEAQQGEYYHVKVMKNGDSLRVGVDQAGRVVRVVRRVPGQVRVPR